MKLDEKKKAIKVDEYSHTNVSLSKEQTACTRSAAFAGCTASVANGVLRFVQRGSAGKHA